jgi:putative nucleotidyltransferase with HDIG domain
MDDPMTSMNALLIHPQPLPSIPEVVHELIHTFHDPDPDLLFIAHQINKDPVISAQLLRLANAAQFGCYRQVTTVREAAVRLGLDSVRNMVLACGLTGVLKQVPGIDLHHFWGKVFDVAALSKLLAEQGHFRAEEVFTCALLHDLGRLIMHLSLPQETVREISELEPRHGRTQAEQMVVGFTHAELGAKVAGLWNFPHSICEAIRQHTAPFAGDRFCHQAGFIHLALVLVSLDSIPLEAPNLWPATVARALDLEWPVCRELLIQCRQQGHGFAALLAA